MVKHSFIFFLKILCALVFLVALLKQQGVDLKGVSKGSPTNEEVPLLESGGKLEVHFQFLFLDVKCMQS